MASGSVDPLLPIAIRQARLCCRAASGKASASRAARTNAETAALQLNGEPLRPFHRSCSSMHNWRGGVCGKKSVAGSAARRIQVRSDEFRSAHGNQKSRTLSDRRG
jgi:hypothetical protein